MLGLSARSLVSSFFSKKYSLFSTISRTGGIEMLQFLRVTYFWLLSTLEQLPLSLEPKWTINEKPEPSTLLLSI